MTPEIAFMAAIKEYNMAFYSGIFCGIVGTLFVFIAIANARHRL